MKKFIFLIATLATLSSSAQSTTVSNDNAVSHDAILDLGYQFKSFKYPKETGSYGFGVNKTSFYRNNKFHIGADFRWELNAGLQKDMSLLFELGPSGRIDFSKDCFVNAPLNIVCQALSYTDQHLKTKTELYWGLRLAPSFYFYFSRNVGIFVGPQLFMPFYKNSEVSVGLQCGVAISI